MRIRQFYKSLGLGIRATHPKTDDYVQAMEDLKIMQQTAGWKRIQEFIASQRKGSLQYAETQGQLINGFSLVWLFSTFLKWLAVVWENRAYNRIDGYIATTIQRGEKYKAIKIKMEAKKEENEQRQQ